MKKITLISACLIGLSFCISGNTTTTQNNSTTSVNAKALVKEPIESPTVKDYKKASDSLLTIAEQNNLSSVKILEEAKKNQVILEQQKSEMSLLRKEIKENLNETVKTVVKKINELNEVNKHNKKNNVNTIILDDKTYVVDSVYKKGNLFRIYEVTFPDGTKKKME